MPSGHVTFPADPVYTLVTLYDAPVQPRYRSLALVKEPIYAAWRLRRGRVQVRCGDETFVAAAGQWLLHEPLWPRAHTFSADAELLSIRWTVAWRGLPYFPPRRPTVMVEGEGARALDVAAAALAERARAPAWPEPLSLAERCRRDAALAQFLAGWHELRGTPSEPPLPVVVEQLLAALVQQVRAGPLDHAALRQATGLGRVQLARLAQRHLGLSPRLWVEQQLLAQAKQRLQATPPVPTKAVAAELGFADASHFAKWFRQRAGPTPTAFRADPAAGSP